MYPSPSALAAAGYTLRESFDYRTELVPFVQQSLRRFNVVTASYWLLNLLLFAVVVGYAIGLLHHHHKGGAVLGQLGYGCALPFLLVPLHELLHGVAYRGLGAPRITYIANWRQFHFAALADGFVVGRRGFWLVAFTPFVVLTAALVGSAWVAPPLWRLTLLMMAFVHAALCSGDFALAAYFWQHRTRELVTYDDLAAHRVWFYERIKQEA